MFELSDFVKKQEAPPVSIASVGGEILEYDNISCINDSNETYAAFDLFAFTHEARMEAYIYGVLFLLAASGNVPVLVSLFLNRRRKSRVQSMILHLTIADVIVTFIMIPLEISWRMTVEWIAGDAMCRIMLFLRAFGPYLSSAVLICISLDRYFAIVHPLRVNDAQRRAKVMLCFAWAGSFVSSVPQSVIFHVESHPVQHIFRQCVSFNFFQSEYQKVIYNLFCISALYGVPLSVIVYCYAKIFKEIHKRSKHTYRFSDSQCAKRGFRKASQFQLRMSDMSLVHRARVRTLKMTLIIVLTFFLCWTPYVVIDLWYLFDSKSAEALDSRIQTFLFMFAVFNSCVNPLVYGSYTFNFAAYFRRAFKCSSSSRSLSRQASVMTHLTQADRLNLNGCIPYFVDENHFKASPQETISAEPFLELRQATPVRKPLNRGNRLLIDGSPCMNYRSFSDQSLALSARS